MQYPVKQKKAFASGLILCNNPFAAKAFFLLLCDIFIYD